MNRNLISNGWKARVVAGLMIAGGIQVAADEQDQVWLTGSVKGGLTDRLTLKVAEQIRYKDEDYFYRHTDLGVGYKLNRNWSVCGTFRYVEKKNKADEWLGCDGYLLDVINTMKGRGVQLKSRMRLSYFDPNYDADCSTDFRPRFDLMPAKGLTSWTLKPYLADEVMIDLKEANLYRNRVIAGLKASPVQLLTLDLFVMQECTQKNEQWTEHWNSGLSLTLNF